MTSLKIKNKIITKIFKYFIPKTNQITPKNQTQFNFLQILKSCHRYFSHLQLKQIPSLNNKINFKYSSNSFCLYLSLIYSNAKI